jgi:hypothetical protein
VELVEDVLGKDLLIAPGLMMQYEELSKFEREKLGPVPAAIGARMKNTKKEETSVMFCE